MNRCSAIHPEIGYTGQLCPLCHEREAVGELQAEVQRLQRALDFWMPQVPGNDPEIADRAGDDAYLLAGFEGPTEKSAEDLGWITLRGRVAHLEREIMTAHALLPQNQYGCPCEVCAKFEAARAAAYEAAKRAEVQL